MVALSASRISTAKSCSWKYWCSYKLKLPEATNNGALMGTVCHALFECLGNPRHRKHYDAIIKEQSIDASPQSARLLKYGLDKVGIKDAESLALVKAMCLNGINYDFYAQKYEEAYGEANLKSSEEPFDLKIERGDVKYRIKGFIDKLWLFKEKTCALIRDFKSSKKMYAAKEFEENMQNLMYALAVRHLYPNVIKQRVEFLFLRHMENGEGIMRGHDLTAEELEGFELFLTEFQKYLDNFDEKAAVADMARKKDFAKDGSFSGPLMCGRAKYPGELKKDGVNPQYYCPFKFGFSYYSLLDKEGNIVSSVFEEEVEALFEKQDSIPHSKIVKKTYDGCPAFRK